MPLSHIHKCRYGLHHSLLADTGPRQQWHLSNNFVVFKYLLFFLVFSIIDCFLCFSFYSILFVTCNGRFLSMLASHKFPRVSKYHSFHPAIWSVPSICMCLLFESSWKWILLLCHTYRLDQLYWLCLLPYMNWHVLFFLIVKQV